MSNHLAIATATDVMRHIVQNGLRAIGSSADLTLLRPDLSAKEPATHVNIYLYRVAPNAHQRNGDLPTRRSDGSLVARPAVALDLFYLLSFHGDEVDGELEAQRLLGAAVSALHAQPIMTSETVTAALSEATAELLLDSDLAEAIDHVRVTPLDLGVDDMSKLWSVFFQTPYTLSIACTCSTVLIETPVVVQRELPVFERSISAVPFARSRIDRIVDDATATEAIGADSTIRISGAGFAGSSVTVTIGELECAPRTRSDRTITIDLADPLPHAVGDLRAGVVPVFTVHRVPMDESDPVASLRHGWISNVATMTLRPTVAATPPDAGDVTLELQITPPVGPRQKATVLLNELNAPAARSARSYVIDLPSRDAVTATLQLSTAGIEPGVYLIRIAIDGAESLLDRDAGGVFDGPTVTIP